MAQGWARWRRPGRRRPAARAASSPPLLPGGAGGRAPAADSHRMGQTVKPSGPSIHGLPDDDACDGPAARAAPHADGSCMTAIDKMVGTHLQLGGLDVGHAVGVAQQVQVALDPRDDAADAPTSSPLDTLPAEVQAGRASQRTRGTQRTCVQADRQTGLPRSRRCRVGGKR